MNTENEENYKSYENILKRIIAPTITAILKTHSNIGLNYNGIVSEHPYNIMRKIFQKYKDETKSFITSKRLDRHKIAACICATILECKPLAGKKDELPPRHDINEVLAAYVGLYLLKAFMIEDRFKNSIDPCKIHIIKKFGMKFPPLEQNICDQSCYRDNFVRSLNRIPKYCEYKNSYCIQFDVWAYSKIFYHLEKYNIPLFNAFCKEYYESTSTKPSELIAATLITE